MASGWTAPAKWKMTAALSRKHICSGEPHTNNRAIAYFSMEIALDTAMPTYSGGLGVLAADTIRSAADLEVRRFPMNEGHAALLALELLDERARWFKRVQFNHEDVEAITRFARESGADRIVVATLGRTGLRRALIGSVAERVVRHAPCPVLVVRKRKA